MPEPDNFNMLQGSVHHLAMQQAVDRLRTATSGGTGMSAELMAARAMAKDGEPEELIALMWPHLILEPEEAELLGRSVRIDDFQMNLISCIVGLQHAEVAIKGAASAGKGCAISIGVVLFYYLYHDALVVMTSASFDHVRKVIWAEVKRWLADSVVEVDGKVLKEMVDGGPKRYIKLANPDSDEAFAGHHSEHVLFVFDEATAVSDDRYQLAKTQAHCIVAAANPRTLSGWFRSLYPNVNTDVTQDIDTPMGARRVITVSGADCANVRLERNIIGGQIDKKRYNGLLQQDDQRWVDVFAHGKFPKEDEEKQIILASWLDRHTEAWHEELPVQAIGLDVAASKKGDETVLAVGGEAGVAHIHTVRRSDTMETVGWVMSLVGDLYSIDLSLGQTPVCVDVDGLGKGVGDRLKELGVWVVPHVGNSPSKEDPRRYQNFRAETYGELARRLDPTGAWGEDTFALPSDHKLLEELVAPEKIIASDGVRFRITPKDVHSGRKNNVLSLRDKLGRSPDRSDAVAYMYVAVRQINNYTTTDTSHIQIGYDRQTFGDRFTKEERNNMPDEVADILDFYQNAQKRSMRGY